MEQLATCLKSCVDVGFHVASLWVFPNLKTLSQRIYCVVFTVSKLPCDVHVPLSMCVSTSLSMFRTSKEFSQECPSSHTLPSMYCVPISSPCQISFRCQSLLLSTLLLGLYPLLFYPLDLIVSITISTTPVYFDCLDILQRPVVHSSGS